MFESPNQVNRLRKEITAIPVETFLGEDEQIQVIQLAEMKY